MKNFVVILVAALLLAPSFARAGDGAHATDKRFAHEAKSWVFGKNARYRYCWEYSDSFGVPLAKALEETEKAFQIWLDYYSTKLPTEKLATALPKLPAVQLKTCDGTENVKFYFGVQDEIVKRELRFYNAPAAFAHPVDPKKGIIWITSLKSYANALETDLEGNRPVDWNAPNALLGILLHEIGHTLGNEHIPGTIMDANILRQIIISGNECPKGDAGLAQIDNYHELVPCVRCERQSLPAAWNGFLGGDPTTGKETERVFKLLFNRKPRAAVNAQVIKDKRRLYLVAAEGGKKLPAIDLGLSRNYTETRILPVFRGDLVEGFQHFALHWNSQIKTPNGPLKVRLGYNEAWDRIVRIVADGAAQEVIFQTWNSTDSCNGVYRASPPDFPPLKTLEGLPFGGADPLNQ